MRYNWNSSSLFIELTLNSYVILGNFLKFTYYMDPYLPNEDNGMYVTCFHFSFPAYFGRTFLFLISQLISAFSFVLSINVTTIDLRTIWDFGVLSLCAIKNYTSFCN